ncbi:unnamed protein product [Cylindrotheca closterium]|uniref:Calpain catalytic domain-containing protein n=1 Tax=Cylindrotheca closterium TaxID=2856 RepID=A0AAD2FN27_9STRA|nr:unnamed protein product [Cylindrotheca closterium]
MFSRKKKDKQEEEPADHDADHSDHEPADEAPSSSRNQKPAETIGHKVSKFMYKLRGEGGALGKFRKKKETEIKAVEKKIEKRKWDFGEEYLALADKGASKSEMEECLKKAQGEIKDMKGEVEKKKEEIVEKEKQVEAEKAEKEAAKEAAKAEKEAAAKAAAGDAANGDGGNDDSQDAGGGIRGTKKKKKKKKGGDDDESGDEIEESEKPASAGNVVLDDDEPESPTKKKKKKKKKKTPSVAGGGAVAGAAAAASIPGPSGNQKRISRPSYIPPGWTNKFAEQTRTDEPDPARWKCEELRFNGKTKYKDIGIQQNWEGSIKDSTKKFKKAPEKYVSMMYQADMVEWDEDEQECTVVYREGTVNWKPDGVSDKGWMAVLVQSYERCKPFPKDEFPMGHRDKYTDDMTFKGKKIHSKSLKPVMPGRGMGVGDAPNLKVIGDIDPSDIFQGSVGDCWLLSGISALAEFDGAIKKLFRKTTNVLNMPTDQPNLYTITLWDLKTFKEVDIVIDERLCAHPDGQQQLLGSKPSEDGEMWAPYLEKAIACHAGGWDKIVGGQCTHAWSLLTGCKEQYTITKSGGTDKYICCGRFNEIENRWAVHGNSPHDGEPGVWPMAWPEEGGGGDGEIGKDELFLKLVAFDKANFIVGAGTAGDSDADSTGGMVDNHAYTVIASIADVCGTGIDLLKVRNPWGKGEIEDGEFDDDGPGWDKYPQIKEKLNPVVADDGIFWVTKDEFFDFFETIYVSASDMSKFLEDTDHQYD